MWLSWPAINIQGLRGGCPAAANYDSLNLRQACWLAPMRERVMGGHGHVVGAGGSARSGWQVASKASEVVVQQQLTTTLLIETGVVVSPQ